jgi:hypothetical protein
MRLINNGSIGSGSRFGSRTLVATRNKYVANNLTHLVEKGSILVHTVPGTRFVAVILTGGRYVVRSYQCSGSAFVDSGSRLFVNPDPNPGFSCPSEQIFQLKLILKFLGLRTAIFSKHEIFPGCGN